MSIPPGLSGAALAAWLQARVEGSLPNAGITAQQQIEQIASSCQLKPLVLLVGTLVTRLRVLVSFKVILRKVWNWLVVVSHNLQAGVTHTPQQCERPLFGSHTRLLRSAAYTHQSGVN